MFNLENKAQEHDLVAECIEKLPADRKCCRLISGVLVQRTVSQVLPVVRDTAKELKKVSVHSRKAAQIHVLALDCCGTPKEPVPAQAHLHAP
jgi:hypothetical protein